MGKMQHRQQPETNADRVKAARKRLRELAQQQGVREFDFDRWLSKAAGPDPDESEEDFDRFLRDLREGRIPKN